MAYINADGLYQEFGAEKAVPNIGGEYTRTGGQFTEIEFKITLSNLTEAENILSDTVFIPAGVRIAGVTVVTHTPAVTGVAIDLGLIRTDRVTQIDYDGLLAAFPLASMDLAGETIIATGTSVAPAGALVGTTTANVGHVTCSRTTAAAFTAGVIYVTIKYYTP